MSKFEERDYNKSVEELIEELSKLNKILLQLDTKNMPDHARGFVQGLQMGLSQAVKPPLPAGVELIRMFTANYQRKYGSKPESEAKTAEHLKRARADLDEMKRQPDWAEQMQAIEKYRYWPQKANGN